MQQVPELMEFEEARIVFIKVLESNLDAFSAVADMFVQLCKSNFGFFIILALF